MTIGERLRQARDAVLKRSGVLNTIGWQRRHWAAQLALEAAQGTARIGYAWGDPERADDPLGNYRQVREWLREALAGASCVLEIGSYGGKWTRYLLEVPRVICVDLFAEAFEVLRRRFGDRPNLVWYQTAGDELAGIASASVDVVFSMDTLVRAPRGSVRRYLAEISRVLSPGGRLLLHLPCQEIPFCRRKGFTPLSRRWTLETARASGIEVEALDDRTLRHGVLVRARKPGQVMSHASEERVSHHA